MISSELLFHRTSSRVSYFVENIVSSCDQKWRDFSDTPVYSLVVAPQSLTETVANIDLSRDSNLSRVSSPQHPKRNNIDPVKKSVVSLMNIFNAR
jgi:hypothetical protein